MIELPGYQVSDLIYESTKTSVFRGIRVEDQLPVALKLLKGEFPSSEDIGRRHYEYELLKSQNKAGIIQVYALERYGHSPVLVIEDFGGDSLKNILASKNFDLSRKLKLAIQIAQIVGEIHQQQTIHKDINLSNIVWNPDTEQIKIIDFDLSTRLSRESPVIRNPNVLEGTLAYISPEQTGRMNRDIDYRTDFYSLGVSLYELFTGKLPFDSADPGELVHCHLTQVPFPPHQINPEIPKPISDIVLKLMSKAAEDRYQGVSGLKSDLDYCANQWSIQGKIKAFTPGDHDIPSHFELPQKLYGREAELRFFQESYHNVCQGQNKMALVTGNAGIGKTALIEEVRSFIYHQQGLYASGKFDQLQRDIPYSAFINAFRNVIFQLLTEPQPIIDMWRDKLREALGHVGQLIIDVIPEVAMIIGQQPAVPDLSTAEQQNRFDQAILNFIKVFAQKDRPLVLFLDDLQWIDTASLKLMKTIITDPDAGFLLLIGAYRENEVIAGHPLQLCLNDIKQAGLNVDTLKLAPLNEQQLNHLCVDALFTDEQGTLPLSNLLIEKTQGNPFFVKQFLNSLYRDELISYDLGRDRWTWDLHRIEDKNITHNVVDLIVADLEQLSPGTRELVTLSAAIGNQFDLSVLAHVADKSVLETAHNLWNALDVGLIRPIGSLYRFFSNPGSNKIHANEFKDKTQGWLKAGDQTFLSKIEYEFVHDRIQQAAYNLIAAEKRHETHLTIGRLLLKNTPLEQQDEKLFDIVNHLNLGSSLLTDFNEKTTLARLNLSAGQKAKASAAYDKAVEYLMAGIAMLGDDCWQNQYDLCLALHSEAVGAANLSARFEEIDRFADPIMQNTTNIMDRVCVYEARIAALQAQNRITDTLTVTREILAKLGVRLPKQPTMVHVLFGLIKTMIRLYRQKPEDIINLPAMTDLKALAIMRILVNATATASRSDPNLLLLMAFERLKSTLKYGLTSETGYWFAGYGLILIMVFDNIEAGHKYGKLVLSLKDKFGDGSGIGRSLLVLNAFISHWKFPLKKSVKGYLEGYQLSVETGDIESATMSAYMYCSISYLTGCPLEQVSEELSVYRKVINKFKDETNLNNLNNLHQAVLNLKGQSNDPCRLIGEVYDESVMLPKIAESDDRSALFLLYLNQLMLCYLFGRFSEAIEIVNKAKPFIDTMMRHYYVPLFYFYESLSILAFNSETQSRYKKNDFKQVKRNQKKLQKWARYAPMNYLHKFHLVEAETARIAGKNAAAMTFFTKAIAGAKENQYLQEEALANERAGKFYLNVGQYKIAESYIKEACYLYKRWGAAAKVESMVSEYPQWLPMARASVWPAGTGSIVSINSNSSSTSGFLDYSSILKASQTISEEIVREELLQKLLKLVIENAGAEKAFLITKQGQDFTIEAGIDIENKDKIIEPMLLADSKELSQAVVQYVVNTENHLVIDNAAEDLNFSQDPYIVTHTPKSILCLPIHHQRALTGVLYLENSQLSGVFTPDRIEVLQMLASQAAISLENAKLYNDLKKSEKMYRGIYESAVEGIFQIRADGQIISANPAIARIFGFRDWEEMQSRQASFGKDWFADTTDFYLFQENLSSKDRLDGLETRFFKKDGQPFWASIYLKRHSSDDNDNPIYEGMLVDITDKKQKDAAERDRQIAEEANKSKSDFLANISHELRTPMQGILGFSDLGIKRLGLVSKDKLKNYFTEIGNSGSRLLSLINNLLDLTKLDAGKEDYDFTQENLSNLVKIIINEFIPLAEDKSITIEFQNPELNALAEVDAEKVLQVLRNLVSNAVKFSGPQSTIDIKITDQNADVCLSITDHGVGVPANERDEIFEKFAQSSRTKSHAGGTGLGLAICRHIVDDHGGKIWVEDNPSGGAVFKFTLPKIQAELASN